MVRVDHIWVVYERRYSFYLNDYNWELVGLFNTREDARLTIRDWKASELRKYKICNKFRICRASVW